MTAITAEMKRYWRHQHIQTRMFALQANLQMLREKQQQLAADRQFELYQLECLFHAGWEGRHAAARWLIEFVGVTGLRNGKAVGGDQSGAAEHDFRVSDLGGQCIDLNSDGATKLARLRKDINKATSHPTHASGHDPISEARLNEAALIIKEHLQATLYAPAGETLR